MFAINSTQQFNLYVISFIQEIVSHRPTCRVDEFRRRKRDPTGKIRDFQRKQVTLCITNNEIYTTQTHTRTHPVLDYCDDTPMLIN